jgi:hypothetical protein
MDVTTPASDSPAVNNPEPLQDNALRLANLIQVTRHGAEVEILIDGQPFPYVIAGMHTSLGPDAGIEIVIPCQRMEFRDEPQPVVEAPARVEVPDAIARLVAGIAEQYPAVTYHKGDPNRAAIEQAAADLGLECLPTVVINPRTVKGVNAPVGAARG